MKTDLEPHQTALHDEAREFCDREIVPFADAWDRDERMPPEIVRQLSERGYLGAVIPKAYGGREFDMVAFGLIIQEIGRGSASLLSLLTVHGMVSQAIAKWGSKEQRERWLPRMAKGEILAAFGLTEPKIGSDARNVETTARAEAGGYALTGEKRWTSCGQIAHLYLIFGQLDGSPTAFLLERETDGLEVRPVKGLLGFRSAMIAELSLKDCRIPAGNLVARPGFGFSHVGNAALDHGRFCVGWGCTGLAMACLNASLDYSSKRRQGGGLLRSHQLIQQMVAEMITGIKASRLLCLNASALKDAGEPDSIMETSIAKYFASRVAVQAANSAVQIHGANGCGSDYPVQRYFRDARIMEIIEGSTQIQQIIISKSGYMQHMKGEEL